MQGHSPNKHNEKKLVALGLGIRRVRKERGLSQEALADLAGLDRSHMGRIERGERNVTILNIFRVSAALGCATSELFESVGL